MPKYPFWGFWFKGFNGAVDQYKVYRGLLSDKTYEKKQHKILKKHKKRREIKNTLARVIIWLQSEPVILIVMCWSVLPIWAGTICFGPYCI